MLGRLSHASFTKAARTAQSALIATIAVCLLTACQELPHHNETDPALRAALQTGLAETLSEIPDLPDSSSIRRRRDFQIERLAKHLMDDLEAMRYWPEPGLNSSTAQFHAKAIIQSQDDRGRGMQPPQLMAMLSEAETLTPEQTWLLRAFCSAMITEQRLPPPQGYWPDAVKPERPEWQQ